MPLWFSSLLNAEAPVASYIFPAGGQRGSTVSVRVGGLFLNKTCGFEMLGKGVEVSARLQRSPAFWLEGPLLPLPDSQQAEDYPRDMGGQVKIAGDAEIGVRPWRVWTSQGATPHLKFMVGELPEIVEQEIEGRPIPVEVKLPVTINGRINPREDVDIWTVMAKKGQTISCEVHAARLGSPLDSRIEVRDPEGRMIAENDDYFGADSFLRFTAQADGHYQVRIHDINFRGGPAYVYRLTVTSEPQVERVFPLGGKRGSETKFALTGQAVPADVTIPLPADGPREYRHRLTVGDRNTNPFAIDLDDLPEHLKAVPAPAQPVAVGVPCVVNGRIGTPGESDAWAVSLRKGQACQFDLRAQRLGSPLHGAVTVADAAGKEIARAESGDAGQIDPVLRFIAPADGNYTVRVAERFRNRGGPAFAYRLRMTSETLPDFRLALLADAVTLPRNGQAKLKVQAERIGSFVEPITLEIDGLPAGVTVSGATIPAKQNGTELVFKADGTAKIAPTRLTIRGTGKLGEQSATRTAGLSMGWGAGELDSVLLAVALPTPFKIIGDHAMRWGARGTMQERHYRIERNGFTGPIEINLADRQARHLQGVTAPSLVVGPDVGEFDYAIQLPPWMETGRTCRVCVMGSAVVKDADGGEHEVTYSSVQPNEQFIIVVEPERLGITAAQRSLRAVPGEMISLPVQVSRGKGLTGKVQVQLIVPPHIKGIESTPVDMDGTENRAVLSVRFAADFRGPVNSPLLLRATLMENGKPVRAEMKVEIQLGSDSAKDEKRDEAKGEAAKRTR